MGRALAAITYTLALTACGSMSQSEGPEPAPGGIADVEWPKSTEAARALLDRLPEEFQGVRKNPLQVDDDLHSVWLTYGDASLAPTIVIEPKREWQTATESFLGLYGWLGCDPSDPDFRASANVSDLVGHAHSATAMPTLELAGSAPAWVECTSVIGVDSGNSLPPDRQARNLVWQSGDWDYGIFTATEAEREALLKELVAAADS